MFTSYDMKGQLYSRPFWQETTGAMLRDWSDLANNKEHPIGQHPEDYCLYEVGVWDDKEGKLISHKQPMALGKAVEFVKPIQPLGMMDKKDEDK